MTDNWIQVGLASCASRSLDNSADREAVFCALSDAFPAHAVVDIIRDSVTRTLRIKAAKGDLVMTDEGVALADIIARTSGHALQGILGEPAKVAK